VPGIVELRGEHPERGAVAVEEAAAGVAQQAAVVVAEAGAAVDGGLAVVG